MEDSEFPGVFNLACGATEIGQAMSKDKRLPLVSFTGSSAVGRIVGREVADRYGKSILELGGNNAVVVMDDANLDNALRAVVFGAVGTAGQRCTSTRRVLLHESIADEFTEKMLKAYPTIRIGDPLDPDTLMGPLVTQQAVMKYESAVERARSEGAEVLCGGKARMGKGHYVEPTIVRATNDMGIVQEETFAPIVYLIPFKDLDEALALHNDVPQGLSSAIFTESMRTAETFLSHRGSDCGIANVNIGTSGAEIGGAFGGEKETGGGREAGSDSWKAYMRRQTNTINWGEDMPLAQGVEFDV
jgi:aldehyde dehydrogenase (NAD+)